MLHKCSYEQLFVVGWPQVPTKQFTHLLIHPTPATWGENKNCQQKNSWVKKKKTGKPLPKYHCRQNRPDLGNLIAFVVHEHEHLITVSGIGKWTKKEVEQLKQLSSLLLKFNFSPSISPPTLVTAAAYPQSLQWGMAWGLDLVSLINLSLINMFLLKNWGYEETQGWEVMLSFNGLSKKSLSGLLILQLVNWEAREEKEEQISVPCSYPTGCCALVS